MIMTCTIHNLSGRVLATGTVIALTKASCNILLSDFTAKIHLPEPGQSVMLHLTCNTYGIRIYSAVTESHTYSTMSFADMQLTKTIQRRNDIKIKLHAQLCIYPMTYETKDEMTFPVPDLENEIAIDLADISAGGIGFYCNQELDQDKFYLLRFTLTDSCTELKFVILRRVDHARNRYFYGCRFHDTPPPVEHALRSFIYRYGLYQSSANI